MSALEPTGEMELVVAEDGSIPADQLASLGLRPGTRLRVVRDGLAAAPSGLAGSLPDLPDLDLGDFKRANGLAQRQDAATSLPSLR